MWTSGRRSARYALIRAPPYTFNLQGSPRSGPDPLSEHVSVSALRPPTPAVVTLE